MIRAGAMLPDRRALRKAVAVAKIPTPAARPSSPSIGLNALAQATSQWTVSWTCHQVSTMERPAKLWIWTPALQAKAAAMTWPRSFIQGLSPRTSSRSPVAKATRMAGKRTDRAGEAVTEVVDRVVRVTRSPELAGRCRLAVDGTGVGRSVVDLLRRAGPCCVL